MRAFHATEADVPALRAGARVAEDADEVEPDARGGDAELSEIEAAVDRVADDGGLVEPTTEVGLEADQLTVEAASGYGPRPRPPSLG